MPRIPRPGNFGEAGQVPVEPSHPEGWTRQRPPCRGRLLLCLIMGASPSSRKLTPIVRAVGVGFSPPSYPHATTNYTSPNPPKRTPEKDEVSNRSSTEGNADL